MKEGNVVVEKAFRFAVRVVRLSQYLTNDKKEFVLSKQILKSGTSIGANLAEAEGGQSKADFIAKCQISYKEANETKYWLKLLHETDYLDTKLAESLLSDVQELIRILQSIIKTAKKNEEMKRMK